MILVLPVLGLLLWLAMGPKSGRIARQLPILLKAENITGIGSTVN